MVSCTYVGTSSVTLAATDMQLREEMYICISYITSVKDVSNLKLPSAVLASTLGMQWLTYMDRHWFPLRARPSPLGRVSLASPSHHQCLFKVCALPLMSSFGVTQNIQSLES